jgi:hypothetical protein
MHTCKLLHVIAFAIFQDDRLSQTYVMVCMTTLWEALAAAWQLIAAFDATLA